MLKLGSILLLASAASPAAARFVHPNRRAREVIEGSSIATDRDLAEGDSIQFDPPIPVDAYLSDTCLGDTEVLPSKVASIRVLGDGEFCIGSITIGPDGTETTTYALLDEITCTPWGIYDRFSSCDDATCTDCTPDSVSYYSWDETGLDSVEGVCFFSSYSFDPTTFKNLQDVSFVFADDANMVDAATYMDTLAANSCIADGVEATEDEKEEAAPAEEDEDEDNCLSLPELVCAQGGFSILCDFLKEDPAIYETASNDLYTLFAPSDDAISDIAELFESLDDEDTNRVILFHITTGVLKSEDLVCKSPSTLLEMVEGGSSRIVCNGEGDIILKGGGNRKNNLLPVVIDTDIMACNGVMHVVSEVMLPNFIDEF